MRIHEIHTIVLGSGAAGLNAALQLKRRGMDDLLLLTEGLEKGASINTGSDKQTYYKLGLYGADADSPRKLAETLAGGGAMHGDHALVEAALSARAFYNLLELGVAFPQDGFGQFPGYKTDHDPLRRATSIGPYTSRDMCRRLITEIKRIGVPIRENRVAVKLLTTGPGDRSHDGVAARVGGVVCINTSVPLDACVEVYLCENLVFALGGPGGLYRESVYPEAQTGGIGLALDIGAETQNLAEMQFGLASTGFRWNVSGTYMQVLPRVVSLPDDGAAAEDGTSDAREFLAPYFDTPAALHAAVFLKGYQWPFDVRKIRGSSLIDLLVYVETIRTRRRVFLDYRTNPDGLDFAALPDEVRDYLAKSGAAFGTPIERLEKMNPVAVALYREHGIDLRKEPLEIGLCMQHNNGGLAVDHWWRSTNIAHLFAAGEVAGTHGIARPGGSALNAGQVAGFRIAEYIAARNREWTLDKTAMRRLAEEKVAKLLEQPLADWESERLRIQEAMSTDAGPIVASWKREKYDPQANPQAGMSPDALMRLHGRQTRYAPRDAHDLAESLRTFSLLVAQAVYGNAIAEAAEADGPGSRGSRLVLRGWGGGRDDQSGEPIHPLLPEHFRFLPENQAFRECVHLVGPSGVKTFRYEPCRAIPECDAWFETAWADYLENKRFDVE